MCGIVGYVGGGEAAPMLLDGLQRLEYRGYDSCGIAILNGGPPQVVRSVGRVSRLKEKMLSLAPFPKGVVCGVGHTRWATHGRPSEENAHPHSDCTGSFVVVHNGIIENHLELRTRLASEGHIFNTATDTEVLPHLIESCFKGNLEEAVRAAMSQLEGVFSIVVLSSRDKEKLVAARRGPPLVIAIGDGEHFIASDAAALASYSPRMIFVEDGEIAILRPNSVELRDQSGDRVLRRPQHIAENTASDGLQGHPHFMIKEIFEQPAAIRRTLEGRLSNETVTLEGELGSPEIFKRVQRILILGCGTSLHAGLAGKFMIENVTGIPVDVDYASEFRYRAPIVGPHTIVLGITQSGETADTLGALRYAREKGAFAISICNVPGSMAARQSDRVLYTRAGPEIGVASTKALTTQLAVLYMFALHIAKSRGGMNSEELRNRSAFLSRIPRQIEDFFWRKQDLAALGAIVSSSPGALYLGRGVHYPIALEGALKLKEVAYIHAEGYPAGEMKHGPIALIDSTTPIVAIAPLDRSYQKMVSNIQEVKAREGIVVAVISDRDTEVAALANHVIRIPGSDPLLNPLLSIIPLQLLAYYAAVNRGCDVDKPRNLAKSVTVE
jgi:glucosamine--fructose-6-phosphate aminotransferase (isomerizing)